MCVIPNKPRKLYKLVVGWKIFEKRGNRLDGLMYGKNYKRNRKLMSKSGPGFQAFILKEDAVFVAKNWGNQAYEHLIVLPVFLHNAQRGEVVKMSGAANKKRGLVAKSMTIPSTIENQY